MSLLGLLGLFGLAIGAGVVAHELAHWAVWVVAGRRPTFSLREVRPRAGPRHTTTADRVAAGAPYALGLTAIVSGFWAASAGAGVWAVVWAVFGSGMVARPSRVDMATLLGQAEWKGIGN